MTIYIGGTRINDIKIGSTAINSVWIGANKVWERNYTATVTVGSDYVPPIFNQNSYTRYGFVGNGSLTNNDAASFSEDGAIVGELHWYTDDSITSVLVFQISKTNGFASSGNSGWTTLTIGNQNYQRSNMFFSESSYGSYGGIKQWAYYGLSSDNPFGTTVGATVDVAVT